MNLKEFIVDWNLKYPYDRIWRLKYKIPFGSSQHKEMSHIDMLLDLLEDKKLKEMQEKEEAEFDKEFFEAELPTEAQIVKNQGQKTVLKVEGKELDEDFDNLDFNNIT